MARPYANRCVRFLLQFKINFIRQSCNSEYNFYDHLDRKGEAKITEIDLNLQRASDRNEKKE